jgi:hypothetical protein
MNTSMRMYVDGLALMAATVALCNLVILAFRHPRLPARLGSEFVAMMVGVLLTVLVVCAYAEAASLIASTLPKGHLAWVMIGVAAAFVALALLLTVAMGMGRRLRQAAAGASPFAPRPPLRSPAVVASA